MAANKFATMLHRNTNRIAVVLVYAVLEWALIALLLLNSLFSYLILRFADYFGLQRPCPCCSRLDHLFDSRGLRLRDLVCPRHAAEISRLGFCSSHRRLAELSGFCEDCLSSPSPGESGCGNGELNSVKCSCCGLAVEKKLLCWSPLEDRNCIEERDAVADRGRSDVLLGDHPDEDQGDEEFGEFKAAEPCVSEKPIAEEDEKVVLIMEKRELEDYIAFAVRNDSNNSDQTVVLEDDCRKGESVDVSSGRHLDFFIGGDDCELIPVEWTESIVVTSYPRLSPIMEEDQGNCGGYDDVIIDFCLPSDSKPDLVMEDFFSGNDFGVLDSVKQVGILQIALEDSPGNSTEEGDRQLAAAQNVNATEESLPAHGERRSPDEEQGEQECASQSDEVDAEVSIRSEIPDQEAINVDEIRDEEAISWKPCKDEVDAEASIGPEICDQEAINVDEIRDEEAITWDPCKDDVDAEVSIGTEICDQEAINVDEIRDEEAISWDPCKDDVDAEVSIGMEIWDQEAINVDEIRDEEAISWDPCKDEVDAEVSIGTEICDQEAVNVVKIRDEEAISWEPCTEGDQNMSHSLDYYNHDADIDQSEWETLEFRTDSIEIGSDALNHQFDRAREGGEDSSTSHDFPQIADLDNHGADSSARHEEETLEFRNISIEMSTNALNHQSDADPNENEDERIPDTPTSIDSLHQLHRRLLLLEKRDSGSTEESLDGSVMSEIEGDEGTVTVEKLKLALRAERKTLHALYTELEEERSASAVAASQTMAMINRLQEEKAAMQMEALQYQRMMEEQSEYDQEALQLLNDLMVKRERQKEEVEKELEVYRRKVEEYEAKEKRKAMMVVPRDSKDSSDSYSNEESDGLSIDLNEEAKGVDAINGHGNTPSDAVLYLEESLANFEEERALILKQLKSLEENILNVNGEEEEEQWHCKENGNGHVEISDSNGEVDGSENGHCKMNGNKHNYRHARFAGPKAKRLLPLFDAIGEEMDEDWSQKTPADHFEVEDGKVALIEEEVDHIYERLQVLEADREFLKHCIGSLRKGDKGLELLGEILQHLRDLRCTELHGRDVIIGDGIMQY